MRPFVKFCAAIHPRSQKLSFYQKYLRPHTRKNTDTLLNQFIHCWLERIYMSNSQLQKQARC